MDNQVMEYERFDGCYGTVTSRCGAGAFILLDNGQEAFSYNFSSLTPMTKVLCTVMRLASEGKKMLVSIDSVIEYAPYLAA